MDTIIRCASYNILCVPLATEKLFDLDNPSHLHVEHRLPLIVSKLESLMERKYIICLQEVDVKLAAGGLHQSFIKHGYYPLTAHYSNMEGMDYYGNFIVFPTDIYTLVTYGQIKIGSFITIPEDREDSVKHPNPNSKDDLFSEAMKRDRALIYAVLEDKVSRKRFIVFNYHMPGAHWFPAAMMLHADALLHQVEIIGGDLPYVLCGDFNIIKGSSIYNFITNRVLPEGNIKPTPKWVPQSNIKLIDTRSDEVRPTNWTRNTGGREFKEIIDYIFCNDGFKSYLSSQGECTGIMPNENEGSDHIEIICELTL